MSDHLYPFTGSSEGSSRTRIQPFQDPTQQFASSLTQNRKLKDHGDEAGGLQAKRPALVSRTNYSDQGPASGKPALSQTRSQSTSQDSVSSAVLQAKLEPVSLQPSRPPLPSLGLSPYESDIHKFESYRELFLRPKERYMEKQRDINYTMRAILMDWLVEVADEYRLHNQTLFVAAAYIDRFLSKMSVERSKLQLVGVTCMLLAAKYEEIYPPAVDDFVYITDNTYNRQQVLAMEHLVLKVLKFDMGSCTPLTFLDRFLKLSEADEPTSCLARYLCELTLLDGERYLRYLPSVVAASATATALYQRCCAVPDSFREFVMSSVDNGLLAACMGDMFHSIAAVRTGQQQAIREKYSRSLHHKVATEQVRPAPHNLEAVFKGH